MSTTTKAVALAASLGLLLGGGAVWLASGTRGRAPAPAAAPEPSGAVARDNRSAAAPMLAAAALRAAIREEVRSAVHDEVAAAASAAPGPAPEPVAKEPPPPTASYEQAKAHVVARLTQGSWSNADREQLHDLLGEMTDAERIEVIRQVIVAVNKGQLRVQVKGPLF
jgi:hypothetical protein